MSINLAEDHHVHSTFSDGVGTLEENLAAAMQVGLQTLVCVDHVRKDTDWLPAFAAAVRSTDQSSDIRVLSGVEAKLCNTRGLLDMPQDISAVDRIYAADHRFPLPDGPASPRDIREGVAKGAFSERDLMEMLVESYLNCAQRYENLVFAHAFSILPKIGLRESDLPSDLLHAFVTICKQRNIVVEVDERWRCPSLKTVQALLAAGVTVVASSDSHRPRDIGKYSYLSTLVEAL